MLLDEKKISPTRVKFSHKRINFSSQRKKIFPKRKEINCLIRAQNKSSSKRQHELIVTKEKKILT